MYLMYIPLYHLNFVTSQMIFLYSIWAVLTLVTKPGQKVVWNRTTVRGEVSLSQSISGRHHSNTVTDTTFSIMNVVIWQVLAVIQYEIVARIEPRQNPLVIDPCSVLVRNPDRIIPIEFHIFDDFNNDLIL